MALETPNQQNASCVLLFSNFLDLGNEQVEFACNAGFMSVGFIDPDDGTVGVVLELSNPVNNQEGSASTSGDLGAGGNGAVEAAYITPNHEQIGDPLIDDLENNQLVLFGLGAGGAEVFRISAQVWGQQAILPANPDEPVPAPPP
jgi:hypothetical protein